MKGFDVIVKGGGLAGLITAREVAKNGFSVLVIEEHNEIGLPDRCAGLVSMRALEELNVSEFKKVIQNKIERAVIYSPSKIELGIDASRQNVIVINRYEFDKLIAKEALKYGSKINFNEKVIDYKENDKVVVKTDKEYYVCKYFVDASGCTSLLKLRNKGIIPAARYLIKGKFEKEKVEIFIDQNITNGFFTWIVPINEEYAKVGNAGYGINPFNTLDKFVEEKGIGKVVGRLGALINVGGEVEKFVNSKVVRVGDAAGQTKPTTAGGIYTGGVGGILAGKGISLALIGKEMKYEEEWRKRFGREFKFMRYGRKLFERLNNDDIDKLFLAVKDSDLIQNISLTGDFDFHSKSIIEFLSMKKLVEILRIII